MQDDAKVSSEKEVTANEEIDESKLKDLILTLQSNQNMPLAISAGLASALLGASIWAIITALTHFQIGWMAVGVGFLVGYAVRIFGKGIDKYFGYIGAGFALIGCLIGNLLSVLIMYAREESISIPTVLINLNYSAIPNIMFSTFHPMDVIFYGLALYEGYRFSFKQLKPDEIASIKKKETVL